MLLDPVYRVSPASHTKRSVSAGTVFVGIMCFMRERERQRQRQRQRDKETDRQTDSETERGSDRQRLRQTHRHTESKLKLQQSTSPLT